MSGLKLHQWQGRARKELGPLLKAYKRVLCVAPTGSGKTVIAAAYLAKTHGRVLWLAHRYELLDQAVTSLIKAGIPAHEVGIICGVRRENPDARIIVSSPLLAPQEAFDHVVIDEAHRAAADTYQAILTTHAGRVIGLTATPWRLDGQPLGGTFTYLFTMCSVTELEAEGLLVAPVTYGVTRRKAKQLVQGTGFVDKKLAARMSTVMGDVVAECAKRAPGQRTLVFAVNREHGKKLCSEFKQAKRKTAYLDGETPEQERASILADLDSGALEVVVNVDILTEGYDCPAVKCISIARPTKSLTRFLQYCGRAARSYEGQRPIILDHGGNCWRFGMPNAERSDEWSLDGRASSGESGFELVKHCEACDSINPVSATECSACGASLVTEREFFEDQRELERVEFEKKELERKKTEIRKIAASRGMNEQETEAWLEKVLATL